MQFVTFCLTALFAIALTTVAHAADIEVRKLAIVEGTQNTPAEHKAVEIFTKRTLKRSDVTIETIDEKAVETPGALATFDAAILVGQPSHNRLVQQTLAAHGVRAPQGTYPGPEGFVLRSFAPGFPETGLSLPVAVAAGADDRGTLYALARLLRACRYNPSSMVIPDLAIVDKPAFEYRGIGISHMDPHQRRRTGASGAFDFWSYVEDQTLFGLNAFAVGYGTISVAQLGNKGYIESATAQSRLVDGYGLRYIMQGAPNALRRDDWKDDFRGTRYGTLACVSVPEARELILKGREALFEHATGIDVIVLVAGDVAGCHCEKCSPWVRTYVELCEEIAARFHKHHPHGKVWLTTQELDTEETAWLWDYLNEKPRPWIDAICLAPSGDQLSPYLTGRISHKLERYLGMGRRSRFLLEIQRQIPRGMQVSTFPDISHWVSSQYELPRVSPEMVAVHQRRAFNVRPRQMHDIFTETAGLTAGTSAYSEGIYDDVNKVVWTQLHWNPRLTVEEILEDYFRWYCGPAAAADMVAAALQLETNHQATVLENQVGFERFLSLVRRAGEKIPSRYRRDNWRYLMFLEKGLTDLYVFHKVLAGTDRLEEVNSLLLQAEQHAEPAPILKRALQILLKEIETPAMAKLREEAKTVDDELDAAAGYRFISLLNMVEYDLVGLQWTADRIEEALKAETASAISAAAGALAHYDDPGPGGFYDNCGHPAEQPHLAFGTSNFWRVPLVPGSRPSQVLHNYSFRGEQGVTYEYNELDRQAAYRVKMTFAAPKRAWWARNPKQRVRADGQELSEPILLEPGAIRQVEFDIPLSATADGRLTVDLVPESDKSLTTISEIWLMRKS